MIEIMKRFLHLPGNVAELGVHNGNTSIKMAGPVAEAGKILILIDSFEGMPDSYDKADREYYPEGKFKGNTEAKVRSRVGPDPVIIKGWLPQVLTVVPGKLCFAYLDIDHYFSTGPTLELLWMIVTGGILCDDCVNPKRLAHKAVVEFSHGKKTQIGKQILIEKE